MPKTYNYLATNDWVELQGYNKIGENTFPNLMGEHTSAIQLAYATDELVIRAKLETQILWFDRYINGDERIFRL